MSKRDFLDTNVLVYALDVTDMRKHQIARALLTGALNEEFTISVQVLAEFAHTLLRKYQSTFSFQKVAEALDSLKPVPLIQSDSAIVRRAVEACEVYQIHFYDGMIIAAAERAGSEKIFSEDLNAGQKYFGVSVVNPF